jgi:hypothetical protein
MSTTTGSRKLAVIFFMPVHSVTRPQQASLFDIKFFPEIVARDTREHGAPAGRAQQGVRVHELAIAGVRHALRSKRNEALVLSAATDEHPARCR